MRSKFYQAATARGIPAKFGAGAARFGAPVKHDCPYRFGHGRVCENHPGLPWKNSLAGCQCGAAMPCECNRAEGDEEADSVGIIVSKLTVSETNVSLRRLLLEKASEKMVLRRAEQ